MMMVSSGSNSGFATVICAFFFVLRRLVCSEKTRIEGSGDRVEQEVLVLLVDQKGIAKSLPTSLDPSRSFVECPYL